MQIIHEKQKRTFSPLPQVIIHEYDMHEADISGGVAEIKGRYPEKGFVINRKCKELVYVLDGSGQLVTMDGRAPFAKGDVLLLDINEKYAWEGDMVLFMATTPAFDPAQHEVVA